MRLLLALLLCLAIGCSDRAESKPSEPKPESSMIHAVLIISQSQWPGAADPTGVGAPAGIPLAACRYWIRGISGGTTDVAWHDLKRWPDDTTAFGASLALGVELNKRWPGKVALLEISRGGSSMAGWQPGEFYNNQATITINTAKALLLAEFPGETAITWHYILDQGDTEMRLTDTAVRAAWPSQALTLKAYWEELLDQSLNMTVVLTSRNISGAHDPDTFRALQLSVGDSWVDTDDSTTVDGLHRDQASSNRVGARTAPAVIAPWVGGLSTDLQNKLVNTVRNTAIYARPATTEYRAYDAAGAEVSGNGYSRLTGVTNDTTNWNAAATVAGVGHVKTNKVAFQFPTSATGAGWGTVCEIREFDPSGNERARHRITPQTVTAGYTLRIPAGGLAIVLPAGDFARDAEANGLLDHAWGGPDYTPLTTTYGSYWLGDPQDGGSQLSATRVSLTQASVHGPADSGVAANAAPISLAAEPTATYWAEHDASSGGNLVFSTPLLAVPATGTILAGRVRTAIR